jgi:phage terminase large subunit
MFSSDTTKKIIRRNFSQTKRDVVAIDKFLLQNGKTT